MNAERLDALPVTAGSPAYASADVGAFRVSDTSFPPGLRLDAHTHERTSFGVVLEGSLDVLFADGTHGCSAGTVETKPAGESHANRFGGQGARVLVVEPSPDAAELLRPLSGLLEAPHCFADPFAASIAWRLSVEIRETDGVAPLAIEGLVLELLAHCSRREPTRRTTQPPAWLLEARDLLADGFREPLRVALVARAAGVHPAYLARQFRTYFGTTMAAHVRALRLEWAARQLAGGDASIAAIAAAAGFTDQSSLTRAFRASLGTTPGELRRRAGRTRA